MRLFVSGPMTGYPDYNHEAFHEATQYLRGHGHEVFNPAEIAGGDTSLNSSYYFRICVNALLECDGVVKLPGWEFSKHAPVEIRVADLSEIPTWTYAAFKRREAA